MPSLTKKQLTQVVVEFNDVMALDPPIKKTNPNAKLEADIKEAAEELRDTDEFSPEVEKVLVRLGIREEGKSKSSRSSGGKKTKSASEGGGKKKLAATTFICHMVCDNPKITFEKIKERLVKGGYGTSDGTIRMQMTDTLKAVDYLMEKGKLK
jgi:hypothetical protein